MASFVVPFWFERDTGWYIIHTTVRSTDPLRIGTLVLLWCTRYLVLFCSCFVVVIVVILPSGFVLLRARINTVFSGHGLR